MSPSPSLSHSSSSSSLHSDSDPLLAISQAIVPSRPSTTPQTEVQIHVKGLEGGVVKLAVDAGPGCGGIAWPSGEVLSNYLAYRHSQSPSTYLHQNKIIEVGSGTGLVGLVAGLLDPSCECWITDQKPLLDLMQRNVILNFPTSSTSSTSTAPTSSAETSLNSSSTNDSSSPRPSSCPVKVSELDWGKPIPDVLPKIPDMILAADCVYFEPAFPLLVETLCDLAPIGAKQEILFCWKKRRKADIRFFRLLHKHFASSLVEDDRPGEKEKYEREGVKLMRLVRVK